MCIRDRLIFGFHLSAQKITIVDKQSSQVLDAVRITDRSGTCLLYTSDAADERSSVDLGGRRIIKKQNKEQHSM